MSAIERLKLAHVSTSPVNQSQAQTRDAFGFKWKKQDTYQSPAMDIAIREWLIERYCEGSRAKIDYWLGDPGKIILDAGCGASNSAILLFGERLNNHDYLGIDISDSVDVARKRFQEKGLSGEFLQVGIMEFIAPGASVDIIFSEGVLHHTNSTRESLCHLAKFLKPGGLFMFYVYVKKAVIREFTDDYVRNALSSLSDQEAWVALESLTRLGHSLGETDCEIEVREDIPYLGIKAGKYPLQRFFYWNICKMFYRPELTIDEMNHINFDWFRPANCHRHSPEEIKSYCADAGMEIELFNVQDAGITVIARKN